MCWTVLYVGQCHLAQTDTKTKLLDVSRHEADNPAQEIKTNK